MQDDDILATHPSRRALCGCAAHAHGRATLLCLAESCVVRLRVPGWRHVRLGHGSGDMTQYAGSGWIAALEESKDMSPLGIDVANLLGDVFLGIYHIDSKKLRAVDWFNPEYIEVPINASLCTVDFDHLTRLLVLAHDRMIRVDINGLWRNWLLLKFHQRHTRTGERWQRYETLEDHAAVLRNHYGAA